jgi:hypothetical protein
VIVVAVEVVVVVVVVVEEEVMVLVVVVTCRRKSTKYVFALSSRNVYKRRPGLKPICRALPSPGPLVPAIEFQSIIHFVRH